MRMTLNDFEAKALQVLLSQRFLNLPLFEGEELSEYHISDIQGEMNLEDFIRQYAEVIMEQFKADYEARLKADMVAMLTELSMKIGEIEDGYVEFDEENKRSLTMIPLERVERLIDREINSLEEA